MTRTIHTALWVLLVGISLLLASCSGTAPAQESERADQVSTPIWTQLPLGALGVQIESVEPIEPPLGAVQAVPVLVEGKAVSGYVIREEQELYLALPSQERVLLPKELPLLISRDGATLLQYGDEETKLDRPLQTDLFWVDQNGEVIRQVQGYFAGEAVVSMSDDGFTAVGGEAFGKPGPALLALFSPTGEPVWEVTLQPVQRIADLRVSAGGSTVVSLVTDAEDWLKDHQLLTWRSAGEIEATAKELGIVQKMVLLGDGSQLFVQGYLAYGVVDLASGTSLWWRDGKIRMISPHAAALSPDGSILFLLLADRQDAAQETYRWILLGLDAATGEEVSRQTLPGEHPSTWDPVFEQVTADHIQVLAVDQRLTLSWQGGK